MKFKGFLFDLDGTLIDSISIVEKVWADWARENGFDVPQLLAFIHGKQAISVLRHYLTGASEEQLQQELSKLEEAEVRHATGIEPIAGASALLQRLDELSIPWAIVTSGTVPVARARHSAAALPEPAVFITAELTSQSKPHPEPYLLGAKRLGLDPAECIVVEDAAAGIVSGLAAGCKVVAVNSTSGRMDLPDVPFATLKDLMPKKQNNGWVIEAVK